MASETKKKTGIISKIVAGGGFLLAKGKAILAVIFKVKGLASVLSMLLSIFVYWKTWNLGLAGAVGFVLLLLVHEYGHVIALRQLGVPASAPMFIPFVGAIIGMKAMPKNATDEAYMAMAGPVLGTAGALACFGIYGLTHAHLWLWLASTGFLLNLFNLIPISPLDGGRVIGAVWRGFWYVGIAILAVLAVYEKSFFMWLILIIGMMEVGKRYKPLPSIAYLIAAIGAAIFAITAPTILQTLLELGVAAFVAWHWHSIAMNGEPDDLGSRLRGNENDEANAAYFSVTAKARALITVAYLGLAALLGALLYWTAVLSSHVTMA